MGRRRKEEGGRKREKKEEEEGERNRNEKEEKEEGGSRMEKKEEKEEDKEEKNKEEEVEEVEEEGIGCEKALEILTLIITLRNDVIKKPIFFDESACELRDYEWSFNAMVLLEGWLAFGVGGRSEEKRGGEEALMRQEEEEGKGGRRERAVGRYLLNELELWQKIYTAGLSIQSDGNLFIYKLR